MNKRFINSALREDYIKLVANSIQVHKIEKEPHHRWLAFRVYFLNPDESTVYLYLNEEHRNQDMKLLQFLITEADA